MSVYDEKKDKLIKLFEMKKENGSLLFSVFSYDGGNPKLQISRMYKKKDGSFGYSSPGRMSNEEILFLKDNIDEILKLTNENFSKG